jgi:hypothetical protein
LPHSGFGTCCIDDQARFDSQRKLFAAEAKDRIGESTSPYVIMAGAHYVDVSAEVCTTLNQSMKREGSTCGFLSLKAHHHAKKCQRREEPVFALPVRLHYTSIAAEARLSSVIPRT